MVTRRQALLAGGGAAMAAYLAGCGGSTGGNEGGGGSGGGGEETAEEKPPTPANGQVEDGDLLLANWVDYSDPANYKGYTQGVRAEGQGLGLRLQRGDPGQAARRRLEVRRRRPDRLRGQDDGRPRPDHAADARADPEHQEHPAGVHQDRLRPGQQVLGPQGLRHHELLLADREGLASSRRRSPSASSFLKTPAAKDLQRQLPRGRHAGHGARARRARVLDQHRGRRARSTRPSSC